MVDTTTVVHIDQELHKKMKEFCQKEGLIFWKFVNTLVHQGYQNYLDSYESNKNL